MKVGDIVWIKATGKGPFIVAGETKHLVHKTLSDNRDIPTADFPAVFIRKLDGSNPVGIWPDGGNLALWGNPAFLTDIRPTRPGTGRLAARRFWRKYHRSMVMLSAALAALTSALAALVIS